MIYEAEKEMMGKCKRLALNVLADLTPDPKNNDEPPPKKLDTEQKDTVT